jgi:hypothetical protein
MVVWNKLNTVGYLNDTILTLVNGTQPILLRFLCLQTLVKQKI